MERAIGERAVDAMLDVAAWAGHQGCIRVQVDYAQVYAARNQAVLMFEQPKPEGMPANSPDDYLVMLDSDHTHPYDVLGRLTRYNLPVVAALCFRRSEPHDPLLFNADAKGTLKRIDEPTGQLMRVDAVGFGAVAIQRRVFDRLRECGIKPPWFYPDKRLDSQVWCFGEDLVFCEACKQAGIPVHCDTGFVSPHLYDTETHGQEWPATLRELRKVGKDNPPLQPLQLQPGGFRPDFSQAMEQFFQKPGGNL
jgi:hypothetical protein